jgi:hypothetical protein
MYKFMLVWQSVMDDASKLPAVKFEYKFCPRPKKTTTKKNEEQISFFTLFMASQTCLRFLGDVSSLVCKANFRPRSPHPDDRDKRRPLVDMVMNLRVP